MKTHTSLEHLTGKEQAAIRGIRSRVINHINPLLLYCFDSTCHQIVGRPCFTTSKRTEKWAFSCSLLVILPDDTPVDDNLSKEIEAVTQHLGEVKILVHPLTFFLQQLKAGNLFFCWVQLAATLLYERNTVTQQLPPPINNRYQCQELAEAFYLANPYMPNYLQEMIPEQYLTVTETQETQKQSKRRKLVWVQVELADDNQHQPN